jgi:hypothetical protein
VNLAKLLSVTIRRRVFAGCHAWFSKRASIGRKQPDQTGGHLEKHVSNSNGLDQKPIGYRYTIPKIILKYQLDIG